MPRKHPSADLKLSYTLALETGIIIALCLVIFCTKVDLPDLGPKQPSHFDSEEIALILPPAVSEQTAQIKAPPKPHVPIYIPNDDPLKPEPIEVNEYDLVSRLMIPPLPEEILVESNLHLFEDIEQLPKLIGGEQALQNSIDYPEYAKRVGIQGIVEVEFTVTETGKVLNPVIVKSLGYGCDDAVLKAIQMQRYQPGKRAGEITSFRIKETFQFILLRT
ncbi:MAG: TonB family protein [Gracilimonas sp.]|nr:TonB family protein [Gracilimonas sp.]